MPPSPPPRLRLFNPSCEAEAARGRPGHTPNAAAVALARDLEALPLFLAAPADAVLVSSLPDPRWLDTLVAAGVALPRFVTRPDAAPGHAPAPWGASPDAARLLGAPWTAAHRARYAKTWALPLLASLLAASPDADPLDLGRACATAPAALDHVARLRDAGVTVVALKAPFGTSGRGAVRLLPGDPTVAQRGWLTRTLASQGAVVVEPWRDRALDLSALLDVADEPGAELVGATRFVTDARGQYLGAWLASPGVPLVPPPFAQRLAEAAARVAAALRAHGHRGLAGLDAMVYRSPGGPLRLKPLLEVNPRATMGHVALALAPLIAPGRAAVWRIFSPRDAHALGLPDLSSLGAALARAAPARFTPRPGPTRLLAGALCTNDPARATVALGVALIVPPRPVPATPRPARLSADPDPIDADFFYNPLTTS